MKKSPRFIDGIAIGVLTIAVPCALFASGIVDSGERPLGVLETIHGIPYPSQSSSIVITEEMAHADLFLRESVFAKEAKITISFDPGAMNAIDLGVRENEFWLSYRKYPLYRKGTDTPGFQTKELSIPLTDVLQDTDRSVDLMFFAEEPQAVEWRIQTFRARLSSNMPSVSEIKGYIKSVVTRERAL